MASSNRHWPSLFKSKPCTTHQQWQQELNPYHQKSPYSSGCDERSPEPKPRWNPKPEQIRILEAIFNSGMVNPPRDEIRKIRAQLQEYGQVGDANVFYWFQNRKSRSKHKQRQLQSSRLQSRSMAAAAIPSPPAALTAPSFSASASASAAATSSSSSSSEQSSGSEKNPQTVVSVGGGLTSVVHTPTLPVTSMMNSVYFHSPLEFGCESFLLQSSQGYCISTADLTDIVSVPEPGNGLWSDLMGQSQGCKGVEDESKIKGPWLCGFGAPTSAVATAAVSTGSSATTATVTNVCASNTSASTTILCASTSTVSCPISEMQGFGLGAGIGVSGGHSGGGGALPAPVRSTVFINEVAFEVPNGPLNVREVFGDEAVLINSSGHPVITDEWGSTIQPLQHGASYYLILAN